MLYATVTGLTGILPLPSFPQGAASGGTEQSPAGPRVIRTFVSNFTGSLTLNPAGTLNNTFIALNNQPVAVATKTGGYGHARDVRGEPNQPNAAQAPFSTSAKDASTVRRPEPVFGAIATLTLGGRFQNAVGGERSDLVCCPGGGERVL